MRRSVALVAWPRRRLIRRRDGEAKQGKAERQKSSIKG